MMTMIYGASMEEMPMDDGDDSDDDDMKGGALDTNRFDVAPEKLLMFKDTAVKRKLKTKFVTGQSSDTIIKNLLNQSDSEGEQDAEKKKTDKEQLRKIEANDTHVDKKEKKKKRQASNMDKIDDSDEGSEIESDVEEGEEGDEKTRAKVEEEFPDHKPLKKTDEE